MRCFFHVIQWFSTQKVSLAHLNTKQIQGVTFRKTGIVFTPSLSCSVLSRDTKTVTLRESRRPAFSFFPPSSKAHTACQAAQLVFDTGCLSTQGAHTENSRLLLILDLLLWFKDSETSPNPRAVTADTHPSQSPPAQFGTMEWKATILEGRQCCRGEVGVASSSMLFLLSSLCLSDAPS